MGERKFLFSRSVTPKKTENDDCMMMSMNLRSVHPTPSVLQNKESIKKIH